MKNRNSGKRKGNAVLKTLFLEFTGANPESLEEEPGREFIAAIKASGKVNPLNLVLSLSPNRSSLKLVDSGSNGRLLIGLSHWNNGERWVPLELTCYNNIPL